MGSGVEVAPLRRRTKLAYAGGELAGAGVYTAVNTWLLYYLVNTVGLRPLQAGIAFIIGRTVDAVVDPIMGEIVDRTGHRIPKLRWIRMGAVPLVVTFAVLWWLPALGGPPFLLAVLSFVLFSVAFTLVAMPWMALTPVLAPTYDERTSLTVYRMAFGTLASLVAVALPPIVVAQVTGVEELAAAPASGWTVMGLVLAALALAGIFGVLVGVREPASQVVVTEPVQIASLLSAFRLPVFRAMLAITVITSTGLMLSNSLLPFFLESVLGLRAGDQTLALGGLFLVAIACAPLWGAVAGRLGKGRALVVGIGVHSTGLLLLAGLRPGLDQAGVFGLALLLVGVGLSAILVLPWAITPDVVEFDAIAAGRRREGLLYALNTFAQKSASSIGVFGSSIVATVFGYEAGRATQTSETVDGLALAAGPLVVVVYAAVLLVVRRLPTREQHAAVVAQLEAGTRAH